MSEKTFEIGIPVDEDGFLEMECDFCKNRFMLHADTFQDESYLHFFCQYVGFLTEPIHFIARKFWKKWNRLH